MTESFYFKTAPLAEQTRRLRELELAAEVTKLEYGAGPEQPPSWSDTRLSQHLFELSANMHAAAKALNDFYVNAYNDSSHDQIRQQAAKHVDGIIRTTDPLMRGRLQDLLFLSSFGGQRFGHDFIFSVAQKDSLDRPPSTSYWHVMCPLWREGLIMASDQPGDLLTARGRAALKRLTAEDGPPSMAQHVTARPAPAAAL